MKIVVAIDGSPHADRALAWALREAQLRSAALIALHVVAVTRLTRRETALDREHAAGLAVVHETFARVGAADDDVHIEVPLITGRGAAAAVLHHTQDADLVVLGSRGLGGFPGLLLGSVSQQVAAHARVPVAVVPPADRVASDPLESASIVVGVDGSTAARRALQWAAEEARFRDVPLRAINVQPAPDPALPGIGTPMSTLSEQTRREADLALEQIVEEELGGAPGPVFRRVMTGRPARVLIEEAATSSIVVVGSRGRGGFAGLLLGSVSQQCLAHAEGPVVIVHTS